MEKKNKNLPMAYSNCFSYISRTIITIMPIQHVKSLYAALKKKSLKNLEVFLFCHYHYTDAVGTPTITTVYSRKDIS